MKRTVVAVVLTVAGLVALLSYRTHSVNSPERSQATSSAPPPVPAGDRAVTGAAVTTVYGPVQIRVVLRAGKIVSVDILQHPAQTSMDIQIGQYAFPKLIAETITANSARIDTVSGATYTSGGYIKSLQSALDSGA